MGIESPMVSGDCTSDPGQQRPPLGTKPLRVQLGLFLDETHDPIQVIKVEALAAAHVVYGTTPGDNVAFAIYRLVPDSNYEGVCVALHLVTLIRLRNQNLG
jgi:hypothetical protein